MWTVIKFLSNGQLVFYYGIAAFTKLYFTLQNTNSIILKYVLVVELKTTHLSSGVGKSTVTQ